jgi:hypothetical protein
MTPVIAHMKRSANHIIRINRDGCEPVELAVTKKASGSSWKRVGTLKRD